MDWNIETPVDETCYDCDCIDGWLPPMGENDVPTACPHHCHITKEEMSALSADHENDLTWEEGEDL